jgi:MinD superfamily P-loop ATPase
MKNKANLWHLYQELVRLRASDEKGNGVCEFCGVYINVTRLNVGVYVKKLYPTWFIPENNYICCDECLYNIPEDKINEIRRKYKGLRVSFTQDDIEITYNKLETAIKNHLGWIQTIQTTKARG